METIKILLVDDHPLFRQGLRRVLENEPDMEVVLEAEDGSTALEEVLNYQPDVIITDINMPGMNGLQLARELEASMPEVGVIVLTGFDDEEQIFHAMRSGASAYFPKDVSPLRLIEAIRHVVAGYYVIDDEILEKTDVASWLLRHFDQVASVDGTPNEMFAPLSPREMEILQQITMGRSNKEIAYHLGISRQTVKNHMTSILRKLSVSDRTQAALYAVKRGWIDLRDGEL
jgi:two-component system, NarL family, response regulator DegU